MLKRIISIILLLLIVLLSTTGCFLYEIYQSSQELKQLPQLEYDENRNVIYNDSVYEEIHPNMLPYGFKGPYHDIARGEYWGIPYSIQAVGIEDFGEYIYIDNLALFWGGSGYLKSGFEFPDYLNTQVSGIFINSEYGTFYGVDVFADVDENPLFLKDVLVSTDIALTEQQNLAYMNVHFTDYQTIYLSGASLYIWNDEVYVEIQEWIRDKDNDTNTFIYTLQRFLFKVNDEYQELFKNAIAECSK
jgi:hypothetical protein